MKKIKLPLVRKFGHYAQGLLKDGKIAGYTFICEYFGLYPRRKCYQFPIRFQREYGQRAEL